MTEITFKIKHNKDCDEVTIYENGIKREMHRYHPGTDEGTLIVHTAADWYGFAVEKIEDEECTSY